MGNIIKFTVDRYEDIGRRINGVVVDWVKSNPELYKLWLGKGYEGIFDAVSKHFDMKMHRNDRTQIEFIFTEKQYIMFALKWL